MKILAIRGNNLASLAGEFEVDFQREPLASVGLFAISGPTGAGKSTLLDALCLALFDDTPRLCGADGRGIELPDVGSDTTLPNDRRNILRRGCAEGYAEVDFRGNDGVDYRARWSVRRARNKATGKLQAVEMALLRLDDLQPVCGHLKSEVQRAIAERIGLSFEQFTRAVLLAQNEFFTFLKAGEDERAALLQTLTGTDRFTVLSQRAFERNKLEQDKLRTLQGKLDDQQPLDAEQRQHLEAALLSTRTELVQHETTQQQLNARLRWHNELALAHQQVVDARILLDAAIAGRDAANERQSTLALIEAVQPARALLREAERLFAERGAAAQEAATTTTALTDATQQAEAALAAFTCATTALTELEAQRAEFDTPIAQARQLDTQIATLAPACTEAHDASKQAAAALEQARSDLATHATARTAAQTRRDTALAWLTQHPQFTVLAQGWVKWDGLFATAADEQRNLNTAQTRLHELQVQSTAQAATLQAANATLTTHTTQLTQYESAANAATVALQTYDPEAIARDKATLDNQQTQLQQAAQSWRELCDLQTQLDELEQLCTEQRQACSANQTRIVEIDALLPAHRAAAAQANSAWQVVFEASQASVEALRQQLRSDAPCPVCGSAEHPYVEEHPALDNALATLAQAREQCHDNVNMLTVEKETLTRDSANREQLLNGTTQKRTQLREQHTQREQAWNAIATELQAQSTEPPLPPAAKRDAVSAWLAARSTGVRECQQQITTREGSYRSALAAQQNAQRTLKDSETAHHKAREAVARLQSAADQLASDLRSTGANAEQTGKRLAALLTQLDAAHSDAGWREDWQANPESYRVRCAASAAAWNEHDATATKLAADITRLDAQADGLARVVEQAQLRHDQATSTWTRQRDNLTEKEARRAAVFNGLHLPTTPDGTTSPAEGLSVAGIETAWAKALTIAREHQQACQTVLKAAERQQTALQSTLTGLNQRATSLTESARHANIAVDEWLIARNRNEPDSAPLERTALHALLAHDHTWITAERAALQQLDSTVATTRGALDKMVQLRDTLEHNRPPSDLPDDSAETCTAALNDTNARITTLRESIVSHQLTLRRDDEIRERAAQLVGQIDAQSRAARIWAQMHELIGASDGKKFRNYAQQLTLDVLLAYANTHLADLARRYRLERVPNSLALMVIDQDMGDEQRSVHSLSGGESFLVSLALALGLASLSSHRVKVESLFIDEGFGSLDAETLRVAMDALDSLQALGRKVGVISHVHEMTERIGTRIQIQRQAGGRSQVVVVNAA